MRFPRKLLLFAASLLLCIGTLQAQDASPLDDVNAYFNEDHRPFAKGSWLGSLTFSFRSNTTTDQTVFFQDIVRKESTGFSLGAAGGYFVKDYLAIGARHEYKQSENDTDFLDGDGRTVNRRSASSSNRTSLFLRNYIPISRNQRFNIFNETNISVEYSSTLTRRTSSLDEITKQFNEETIYRIGLRPGINVFIVKGFSFETSLNVIGLTVKDATVKMDEEPEGRSTDVNLDLELSLLSLNFGLSYYF